MKKKDDSVYLQHILDAVTKIENYIHGINEEKFQSDSLIQDGVIRQLGIIGEATSKISPETKKQWSDVPWRDISDMRNKLIHDYFGVDVGEVWLTALHDLPLLKSRIKTILK